MIGDSCVSGVWGGDAFSPSVSVPSACACASFGIMSGCPLPAAGPVSTSRQYEGEPSLDGENPVRTMTTLLCNANFSTTLAAAASTASVLDSGSENGATGVFSFNVSKNERRRLEIGLEGADEDGVLACCASISHLDFRSDTLPVTFWSSLGRRTPAVLASLSLSLVPFHARLRTRGIVVHARPGQTILLSQNLIWYFRDRPRCRIENWKTKPAAAQITGIKKSEYILFYLLCGTNTYRFQKLLNFINIQFSMGKAE